MRHATITLAAIALLLPACGTIAKGTAKVGAKTVGFTAKAASRAALSVAKTTGKVATAPLRKNPPSTSMGKGGYSYKVRGRRYHVMGHESAMRYRETGIASYYGSTREKTASGERVNPRAMTAAHKTLPLGARVRVTNLSNGRSIIVRINDRGPFVRGRIIDVTPGGADRLGFRRNGITKVRVETVR